MDKEPNDTQVEAFLLNDFRAKVKEVMKNNTAETRKAALDMGALLYQWRDETVDVDEGMGFSTLLMGSL